MPSLAPSPTPLPAPRQLTSGGCCVQPFWSPDGAEVWFIDHPSESAQAGLWGVGVAGGEPHFVAERLGGYSADGSLLVYPDGGQTVIERVATGERWVVPTEGRAISISPDSSQIAWQVNSSIFSFDRRAVDIWVANIDGGGARQVVRLVGGGLSGWFPDGQHLLVTHRESAGSNPILSVLALADGTLRPLATSRNLRGTSISPGGGWVAYQITFSGDPSIDGIWITSSDGAVSTRLSLFGPYRWRSEGRLVIVPLESAAGATSHRLVEAEAATGQMTPLTDPSLTPFRIANGDWAISPDGRHMVFLNDADRNLWLIALPEPGL
jgi:Tol biopolymer transport system component